jgi:biotin transport system substrate-specific component
MATLALKKRVGRAIFVDKREKVMVTLALQPGILSKKIIDNFFILLGGSLFLALLAQCSIPLWFTPVPLSLQTLGILLLGAHLGSKRGAIAVGIYLLEGALGLPVFACGSGGISAFLSPSAGYLLGFLLSAFVVGFLFEKGWRTHRLLAVFAFVIGTCITLASGAAWLAIFVGLKKALFLGVVPFLAGDMVKILVAFLLTQRKKISNPGSN